MRVRASTLAGPLVALGAVLLAVVWVDVDTPLRLPLTVTYLFLAPGAAIVAHLEIAEPALELSLVFALSLTVDMLVAQTLVWTGDWNPRLGLAVLVGGCALSALGLMLRRMVRHA